jgi:hypothetical protein
MIASSRDHDVYLRSNPKWFSVFFEKAN